MRFTIEISGTPTTQWYVCVSQHGPTHSANRSPQDHTTPVPTLTTLKCFTLRYYGHLEPQLAINKVCSWIKLVISRCPLEEFNFHPVYQMRTQNPLSKPSWDVLLDHLTDKHARTLRRLDLRAAFVKKRSLKRLLGKCLSLEHLAVGTIGGSIVRILFTSICSFHIDR